MKTSNFNRKRKSGSKKFPGKKMNNVNYSKDAMAEDKTTGTNNFNKISFNDPEWYIYDETMFDGVISMPKMEFKGGPIQWMTPLNKSSAAITNDFKFCIPNVVAYEMNPAAGYSVANNSAINLAARKLYAELSASNAKTSGYAPEDIAMLILSLGQIIAITEHLRRVYGTLNYFNFYNRSVPESLIEAMKVEYATVRNNMADFRSKLNQIIARVDTIQFPENINYFKKCKQIYEQVFVDRDDKMLSFHLMVPFSTWEINESASPNGTILQTAFPATKKYGDWFVLLDAMINSVLESATFNYIFADVINLINRKVLAADTIKIEPVPIDYEVHPLYSEPFNWQIMNTTLMGAPSNVDDDRYTRENDVICDTNTASIIYNPLWKKPDMWRCAVNVPVRLPDIDINPKEFVELLAYYNTLYIESDSTETAVNVTCKSLSDYYCVRMTTFSPKPDGTYIEEPIGFNILQANALMTNLSMINAFNELVHTPFLGLYSSSVAAAQRQIHPMNKLGAFTQIDFKALDNLRYETMLGLFVFKR